MKKLDMNAMRSITGGKGPPLLKKVGHKWCVPIFCFTEPCDPCIWLPPGKSKN